MNTGSSESWGFPALWEAFPSAGPKRHGVSNRTWTGSRSSRLELPGASLIGSEQHQKGRSGQMQEPWMLLRERRKGTD